MTPEQIAEVRPRLLEFAAGMLGGLARSDQRAAGELYVRGLLTDGRRKSMQPMAERLGVDHQRLQQFITSSTWDYAAVRRNVARWFASSQPVEALVVDDTGFPKDGTASPCVARQYSGTLGKVGNCQIGVSVHLVSEHASCAADWRLFCPESWDDTALEDPVAAAAARHRRERAAIPDEVRHTEKWRLALDMIDEMTGPGGWGVLEQITAAGGGPPVVVADAGYGDSAAFRLGLAGRGWRYVLAVTGTASARLRDAVPETMAYGGLGRPSVPRYRTAPVSVRQLAIAHAGQTQPVTWRHGTRITPGNPGAAMTSHFLTIRVRPASRRIPRAADGSLPECWLLAEWPPQAAEPAGYWLSDLPEDTPIAELVRLAKIRWRIEHDYRELKTGLGLAHFEGRSFTGWHRHVTPLGRLLPHRLSMGGGCSWPELARLGYEQQLIGSPGGFGSGPPTRLGHRQVLQPMSEHADRVGDCGQALLQLVHALLQGGRRQLRVASAGLVGHRDTSVQLAQLVLVMVIRRPCGLASGAGTGGLVRLWVVRAGPLRPGAVRSRRPRR